MTSQPSIPFWTGVHVRPDKQSPIVEDIYDYCETMEIDADSLSHEDAAGQLEVNFFHGNPLELADQVFLFKRVVRGAAHKHGIYATFMAKPMEREPGSAMHLHQSVLDSKTGKNIFVDAAGNDSALFRNFIGGLQRYVPEAVILFGPYVNSYRRFTRYLAAPINVQWGYDNRTVGLRVPASDAENRRVENRIPGADTNPQGLARYVSISLRELGLRSLRLWNLDIAVVDSSRRSSTSNSVHLPRKGCT